ncbi:MAG: hypothetical protein EOO09_21780 [Chitinophagaceae bacterium]|nr:MAG: hypothetical protein EOO09_21780 [Chitinophagaceae bacterium]
MPTNRLQELMPGQTGIDNYSSPGRTAVSFGEEADSGLQFTRPEKFAGNNDTDINDAFLSGYGEDEINWEMSQADIDDGREG